MKHLSITSSVALALGLLGSATASYGQSTSTGEATKAPARSDTLEEIVVTAQKYKSTIQDTPISISALSGEQLIAAGISSVTDVAHDVPGLSMRSAGPGLTEFEARGLASTGGASPTVGFYLDEIPLSPPALSQSGKVVIDPNLYDVDRVEVLRGPQGTLYGSGSMGGTIKIVTNEPKIGEFEGSAQATGSYTDGGGANGSANLMLNLPVSDVLAVRVVGSDTYRSGWIDRIVLDPFPAEVSNLIRGNVLGAPVASVARDVNTERLYSGRISVLYKPNEDWSVLATFMSQNLEMGGYDLIDSPPGLPYLAHYEAFNTPEPVNDQVRIYSLTINGNLGFGELTSATSYWNRLESQTQDASESISATLGTPLLPIGFSETDPSHQFSQEIRLSSIGNGALHWTVGAFYSDMTSDWDEFGSNPANTGAPGGIYFQSDNPYNIKQSALFADGSWKFTDTLTLSAGLRWYSYDSTIDVAEWGSVTAYPTRPPFVETKASDKGFNPRINLSYEPTPDLNTYVTAAKGFRPGGANILIPPPTQAPFCVAGSPETFGPDSVWNYEVGEKAKLLGNRVSINSDFYYIKWNGIQQSVPLACGYVYNTNAGDGRSYGPEIEITAKVTDEWTIAANGSITNAEITNPTAAYAGSIYNTSNQPYCPANGNCTIPILNVPHQTGALSLVYATTVGDGYRLTARASDTYTGFATDEAYFFGIHLPPYSIAAARISLAHGSWSANLFVDNLTNKTALMTANNTQFQFNIGQLTRYTTNQPRTIGTQINYNF
jgi:outer membrane receptor protein involved in Fe transport